MLARGVGLDRGIQGARDGDEASYRAACASIDGHQTKATAKRYLADTNEVSRTSPGDEARPGNTRSEGESLRSTRT